MLNRSDWQRLVAGDMAAFRRLYIELAGVVERTVRRLIARAADRDDLVHETWLHIHRKRATFDLDRYEQGKGWVAQIARTRCHEFLRARARIVAAVDVDDLVDRAGLPDAEEVVIATDLLSRARAARDRAVVACAGRHPSIVTFARLYYDDGLGHRGCARALNVTERHTKYLNRLLTAAIREEIRAPAGGRGGRPGCEGPRHVHRDPASPRLRRAA
jgi:DNA-directed RNA polymerase specialized sigma24 family protein